MPMEPISGAVEKKALDSAFAFVRKLWTWHTDIVKENKSLHARLDEKAEFERKKSELGSRQEDDNLYKRKDGTGPYYCPLCLEHDGKFISVLNQFEDSYYCAIHKQVFETEARRLRRKQTQPQPFAIKRRFRWPK
jgi:hypothetical protein